MPVKPTRKRAGGTRKSRKADLRDKLLVWRGYVLVTVGGGALAAVGSAWYARKGDFLTASLFSVSLILLMLVGLVSMGRVRRLRAELAARQR